MKILQINSSARSAGANSTRLTDAVTTRLKAANPGAVVELRDLAANPVPHLDGARFMAFLAKPEERSAEQQAVVDFSDALIAELRAADAIVIGLPMYNFGIPSQLKAYFDHIARAGVTFRYTENGPEGLLKGKKVYVALARGGIYRDTPADSQVPYLKGVLGFLGMTDVEFIYAEGLAMGPESADKAFAAAEAAIGAVVA